QVEKGDVIAEIETDKATMDLEAFEAGVLEKQLVEEGTVVPIGQAVAVIGDGSGASDGDEPEGQEDAPAAAEKDTVAAEAEAPSSELDDDDLEESEEPGQPAETPQPEKAAKPREENATSAGGDKLRMSPLARKLAHDNDIDLD